MTCSLESIEVWHIVTADLGSLIDAFYEHTICVFGFLDQITEELDLERKNKLASLKLSFINATGVIRPIRGDEFVELGLSRLSGKYSWAD